jgi:YidC/Oxa1 family membrane protein insertase
VGFLGDIGHFIMTPLYYAISAILVAWHKIFGTFLDPKGGVAWVLSIIGLTLFVRALLIPLFVKQIKSSRNMQLIQPKVKELQKKYGHDRERLAQETMKLYKESGTNPFASCLPILIQMPIFLALFRLLDHHAAKGQGIAFLTTSMAKSFGDAKIGSIPITATFVNSGGVLAVQILAALLVVAMTATTFTTQRQLMAKNMPADALSGPYAQQQKLLLYVLPLVFAVGGIAFPIGVLCYWTTSNLWTMGQQFYVIRNNPAPGTAAAKAKEERDRLKAERHGHGPAAAVEAPVEGATGAGSTRGGDRRPAQRQQPKKKSREQRKKTGGTRPAPTDADGGTRE